MLTDHWPLFGLRIMTPRLELRVPSLDDLSALADLAADGIHDPSVQPFGAAWTDADPAQRARSTLQHTWRTWSAWQPDGWSLALATVLDGRVVGTQGIGGKHFATLREVGTGSWLGRAFHGQGIGTEMRAAVLHLAFAGLGAECATSGAYDDNPASRSVSRKLGYAQDGIERHLVRGAPAVLHRLRLDRAAWEAGHGGGPVEIHGLEPCLPLFGLPDRTADQ